jgi:competence protein ComEC
MIAGSTTSRPVPLARADPFPTLWRAPLVPIALAVTAGIVLDRYLSPAPAWFLFLGLAVLASWLLAAARGKPLAALVFFWAAVGILAAAYHHVRRDVYAPDDIGHLATDDPQPVLLRGVVDSEPLFVKKAGHDELRSFPSRDTGRFLLEVTAFKRQGGWQPVSGRVQVSTGKPVSGLHVGDEVEVPGRMQAPSTAANPGEVDYAAFLRDQRVRAVVSVKDQAAPAIVLLRTGGWSLDRALALVRGWCQSQLTTYLPADVQGVAIALLLGDGAPMTQDDWQKYIHTGVIHVLAISGQHLVVLAAFLGALTRLLGLRLRTAAVLIAAFLLAYSLMVGGRPPVMRSAVAVCCGCLALFVRRPILRANTFALSWLAVALLSPTDLFGTGCLLSFLAVAVLTWGTRGWSTAEPDPLDRLVEESRPLWQQWLHWLGGQIGASYVLTLGIWVVLTPLIAGRLSVVAPVGLLIGPPTVLLTSVALLSGFGVLLLAWCPPLAQLAGWITAACLYGCDGLVTFAEGLPGAYKYVPALPEWWVWIFCIAALSLLMLQNLRRVWHWAVVALLGWLTLGLLTGAFTPRGNELRCTFLAVGHGGCAVIETPDGRTFLYDVGSLRGPEVARRQIVPYLLQRGIRRVDEVFLSHADLDHYNGLVGLLERLNVGQVSCTPTFTERQTNAVRATVRHLEARGVPFRVLKSGDRLHAGDVQIEVLHPPLIGPDGNENTRSLVLLVRHAGRTILLTGDLEGAGLARVCAAPATKFDVVMAPHHGNRAATLPLLAWASPRVVVSCQGPPRGKPASDLLDPHRGIFVGTWPHGAVTITSRDGVLVVETFQTRKRWRLPAGI